MGSRATRNSWIEDNLRQAVPVAQVDEDEPAMVPALGHPPTEGDLLVQMIDSQFPTSVRPVGSLMAHGNTVPIDGSAGNYYGVIKGKIQA
jgi:hypothetical protein